jgi:RNA polymerase sigma-70 factor (ECF subfamily)
MSLAVGLELAAQADESADPAQLSEPLRALYAEHFSRVYRSLRRLGVAAPQLEDAVQDVFVVVHRRFGEFERRSTLTTWIYGIVLRVAKDYRRAEARHARRIDGLAATGAEPEARNAPDQEAERAEARRLIHEVLATLRDDQREILVLVELEQLSVREAALALGLHVRTCQRRLRAAHQALEAALVARLGAPSGHVRRPTP